MKIALIDFDDSFTYNIVHSLVNFSNTKVDVYNSLNINLNILLNYDKIILSPGAETPKEKKYIYDILKELIKNNKPILGICLGFQILSDFFKEDIYLLENPKHGIKSKIKIIYNDPIFKNIPEEFLVGRYHSWAVKLKENSDFITLAKSLDDSTLMITKHNNLQIYGFQFHPESILTEYGNNLLKNWVNL